MCSTEFTTQEKIYALLRMLEKHYTFVEVRQLLQKLIDSIEKDRVDIKDIKQTTKSTTDGGENVITITLTNGREYTFTVLNFKGDQGLQGPKGDDGKDGVDGQNGIDGRDGINGQDGKDGVNATIIHLEFDSEGNTIITWNNDTITKILRGPKGDDSIITFDDLTPEQKESLKGEPGQDGQNGQDGYTPVKGVDYFDGEPGEQGALGDAGKDASIKSQTFDEDGNTIITWEDGTVTKVLRGVLGAEGPLGPKGDDADIDLTGYVKNTDYATGLKAGVVITNPFYGISITSNGNVYTAKATNDDISVKTNTYRAIVPFNLDLAVKTSVTTNTISLTSDEQTAAKNWLGIKDPVIAEEATFDESTMEEGIIYYLY